MRISDIAAIIDAIAPLRLAQSWDNVGLLIGNDRSNAKRLLLTIDITQAVLAEARRLRTDLIVSYHPIIWDGLKRITSQGATQVVHDLVVAGIPVFSIHTALDAAIGGVNDGLADIVGIRDGKPIGDYVNPPSLDNYKLVVFVPVPSAAKVANALFAAGAGHIGSYSHCSFAAPGEGTFLPLEGAHPAIGKRGTLEKVRELRLETIVPAAKLEAVVAAMFKAHPYETPAYDVLRLRNEQDKFGLGRIGPLVKPTSVGELLRRIKRATSAKAVGIVGPAKRRVRRAAVCAGSCGAIINQVIAGRADLYLTGELKHHQALAAQEAGLTCLCLSHTVSERFILKKFARQLQKAMPDVTITVSKKDADPFVWKQI